MLLYNARSLYFGSVFFKEERDSTAACNAVSVSADLSVWTSHHTKGLQKPEVKVVHKVSL